MPCRLTCRLVGCRQRLVTAGRIARAAVSPAMTTVTGWASELVGTVGARVVAIMEPTPRDRAAHAERVADRLRRFAAGRARASPVAHALILAGQPKMHEVAVLFCGGVAETDCPYCAHHLWMARGDR